MPGAIYANPRYESENRFELVVNKSGGALAHGDAVVYDIDNEGSGTANYACVDTDTAKDSKKFAGIVHAPGKGVTIPDGEVCMIQVEGIHPAAKVRVDNGQTVAKGDLLTTSDVAKALFNAGSGATLAYGAIAGWALFTQADPGADTTVTGAVRLKRM